MSHYFVPSNAHANDYDTYEPTCHDLPFPSSRFFHLLLLPVPTFTAFDLLVGAPKALTAVMSIHICAYVAQPELRTS